MDSQWFKSLFQFHLSTLILFSVSVGSLVGLWYSYDVWKIAQNVNDTPANSALIEKTIQQLVLNQPNFMESSVRKFETTDGPVNGSHIETKKDSIDILGRYVSIIDRAYSNYFFDLGPTHCLETKSDIHAAYLSLDLNYLVVRNSKQLIVYWRSRPYGLKGLLALPVFWIAIASFLGLLVKFFRRLRCARTAERN